MQITTSFILYSVLLGFALAMDAFSVSLTCGLRDPGIRFPRTARIAGCFALFQFAMPMIGWLCVRKIEDLFRSFSAMIPWIALILLCFIGGKMLLEGIQENRRHDPAPTEIPDAPQDTEPGTAQLLMLGIATSIDALSVGFTIESYDAGMAFLCSLIIAVVTYAVCEAGLRLGRHFGTRLAGRGSILGGIILICIGVHIFFG